MDSAAKDNLFPALRAMAVKKGLFEKNPLLSTLTLLFILSAYCTCIAALALNQSVWFVLFDAFLITLLSGQLGFLMHDAGHRQIFKRTWKNNLFGYIATFFNGSSFSTWTVEHNEHHNHPNHEDLDPDIDVFFLSYSEKQVDESSAFIQCITRYQAWLALVFYTFVFYFMRYGALSRLLKNSKPSVIVLEVFLMILWHIAYFGILFALLGFWKMALFVVVHHALTGLHLALVFAPNHKGMPIFEKDAELDWFSRQVMTARNIFGNPITNCLYGGLNFQIEHHLFPTMPRIHLKQAQKITKQYCLDHNVDYCETSIVESYRQVFGALSEISIYARNLRKPMEELQLQFSEALEQLQSDLAELQKMDLHIQKPLIYERICDLASECKKQSKQRHEMHKEKLLRVQKDIRELLNAIRQFKQGVIRS